MKVFAKENFKSIRIKNGFSLVDLSRESGLTKQAIGQIERRSNGVSPKSAKVLTGLLNVDFDEIFELVERKSV